MRKWILVAVVLFVPFIIIWAIAGIVWAVATFVTVGALLLFASTASRPRRRRYNIHDNYDEEIIVTRQPRQTRSSIQRAIDWHIPKVNEDGVEFITGAKGLRKAQRIAHDRRDENMAHQETCFECMGQRRIPCSNCEGTGRVQPATAIARVQGITYRCPECQGKGYLICPNCRGKGYIILSDE